MLRIDDLHVRYGAIAALRGVSLHIDAGEIVTGFPFDGYWQDLGRPDDYERAVIDFDRMRLEFLPEERRAVHRRNGARKLAHAVPG